MIETLADGRRYQVLEELEIFCPLGLRLWDAVRDEPVRDGLAVKAWPRLAQRPVVEAFLTRSGVWAFQGLPGLRPVETPTATESDASPAVPREFVVEVTDPRRRFVPAAFEVELPLPYRGVFLASPPGSPAAEPPPGFYLFPSPVRPRAPEIAAVRGELADAATGEAAARALVRVELPDGSAHYSVADRGGRFAVLFPLPPLVGGLGPLWSSPAPEPSSPPATPILERTWEITVSVAWEPGRLSPLPGTEEPDYRDVLQQAPAGVLLSEGSPAEAAGAWLGELGFDGEVVVRTEGRSDLRIVPGGSPP